MPEKLQQLKAVDKEKPRVASGEVFDPEKEVKKILKAPREEKPRTLKEFKKELADQKEGIAAMQETLEKIIRENPDASLEKLYQAAEDMNIALDLKLTDNQKEIAKSVLEKYVEKHNKIKEVREKYPDDKELFKALFGRYPRGKIEIIKKPMVFYFRIHDLKDFAFISTQSFLKGREFTRSELEEVRDIGGNFIHGGLLLSDCDGIVIIGNVQMEGFLDSEKDIVAHEEQHAVNHLIANIFRPGHETFKRTFKNTAEQFNIVQEYLLWHRNLLDDVAASDLLAYLKQESYTREDILINITIAVKDRIKEMLSPINNILNKLNKNELLEIGKLMEEKFNMEEYFRMVEGGMNSLQKLRENNYSDEKIAALLINEPLAKWPKVAERLLEAKK